MFATDFPADLHGNEDHGLPPARVKLKTGPWDRSGHLFYVDSCNKRLLEWTKHLDLMMLALILAHLSQPPALDVGKNPSKRLVAGDLSAGHMASSVSKEHWPQRINAEGWCPLVREIPRLGGFFAFFGSPGFPSPICS